MTEYTERITKCFSVLDWEGHGPSLLDIGNISSDNKATTGIAIGTGVAATTLTALIAEWIRGGGTKTGFIDQISNDFDKVKNKFKNTSKGTKLITGGLIGSKLG